MSPFNKDAETEFPIHELLRRRWSSRSFAETPVEADKIGSLLEAARWAASSFNAQPWGLVLATREQPAAHAQLAECLLPFNRQWAARAPVLMLAVVRNHFEHNQQPNPHAEHDLGLALGNLSVQATALELALHMLAGFDRQRAKQVCGIPDTHEPIVMLAIGYRGSPEDLPDGLRERELAPRRRKPLQDFVFHGKWGQPPEAVQPRG